MAHRKTILLRPWLTGAVYDRLTVENVLHFDAKAYQSVGGGYMLTVALSWQGMHVLAQSAYERDWLTGDWMESGQELGRAVYWAESHDLRALHRAALKLRDTLPDMGQSRVSFLAHYIRCVDVDPWPRGTLNTWVYNRKNRLVDAE